MDNEKSAITQKDLDEINKQYAMVKKEFKSIKELDIDEDIYISAIYEKCIESFTIIPESTTPETCKICFDVLTKAINNGDKESIHIADKFITSHMISEGTDQRLLFCDLIDELSQEITLLYKSELKEGKQYTPFCEVVDNASEFIDNCIDSIEEYDELIKERWPICSDYEKYIDVFGSIGVDTYLYQLYTDLYRNMYFYSYSIKETIINLVTLLCLLTYKLDDTNNANYEDNDEDEDDNEEEDA